MKNAPTDLRTLWNDIESLLDSRRPKWRTLVEEMGQLAAVERRSTGRTWSDDEVFEALLMAVLSGDRDWSTIQPIRGELAEPFSGFSLTTFAGISEAEISNRLVPWFEARRAGSRSLRANLVRLLGAARRLSDYSTAHGTADGYFTSLMAQCDNDPKQVAIRLGDAGEYKLPSLGIPLAAEALKNLGFDVAKPDRHVMRAIGAFGLVDFTPWTLAGTANDPRKAPNPTTRRQRLAMNAVEKLAAAAEQHPALVDNAIWLLCERSAKKYGLYLTNAQLAAIGRGIASTEASSGSTPVTIKETPTVPSSEPIATVEIEWGYDLDRMSTTFSVADTEIEAKLRGRCKGCWGGLLARKDDDGAWTGIRCRVCGTVVEGKKAQQEFERMQTQTMFNLMNICFGLPLRYDDGIFVQKIFPELDSLPKQEVTERVRAKLGQKKKPKTLTRHDFPLGSAGFLVMQANVLMAGVADISRPDELSVAPFSDIRIKDDGSLAVRISVDEIKNDPEYEERRLANRMGTTMTEAMTAAFACELAMKAICLTCKDEAIRTHDLRDLYEDMPEPSRKRIEADYPEISAVIETGRQTFGEWRYFERNVAESGLRAMIDTQQARALGKAARVLLDEAAMVGLDATYKMQAKRNVRVVDETKVTHDTIKLKLTGGENPPRDGMD